MRVDRTKFTAQYENGVVRSMWVTVEVAVDSEMGDTAEGALDLSKKLTDEWYKKQNVIQGEYVPAPSIELPVINSDRTAEDIRIAQLIRDILACTELDGPNGLWTWKTLSETNEEAKSAYEIMGKKLRKKESEELLDATKDFYKNQPKFKPKQ